MSDSENTGHYTHSNPGHSGRYNSAQKISIHVITHTDAGLAERKLKKISIADICSNAKVQVKFMKANFCLRLSWSNNLKVAKGKR